MVEKSGITARTIASQKRFWRGGDNPPNNEETTTEGENGNENVNELDAFDHYLKSVQDSPVADRVDEATARDYYHNPDAYDQNLPHAVQTVLDRILANTKRYTNLRERQKNERQRGLAGRRFAAAQPLESPYDVEGPPDPSIALRRQVAAAINKYREIQKDPLEVA
jgi:hypothetical protein